MGTKNNPGKFDCYESAEADEPMFVLLGRDPAAAGAVRSWARDHETMIQAGLKPAEDMHKVWDVRECADAMEAFCIAREQHQRSEQAPFSEPLSDVLNLDT